MNEQPQQLEICLLKTEVVCHFTFLTFHILPLPPRKEISFVIQSCCLVYSRFWLRKALQRGFQLDAVFVVHAGFYSIVREKTKAFLTSLTSFQELHFR